MQGSSSNVCNIDRTYLAIRREADERQRERGREDIRTNLLKDNSDPAARLPYHIKEEVTRDAGPADPGGRSPEGKIAFQGLMY